MNLSSHSELNNNGHNYLINNFFVEIMTRVLLIEFNKKITIQKSVFFHKRYINVKLNLTKSKQNLSMIVIFFFFV